MELGRYQHFKGHIYDVLFVGKDSETLKEVVIYQDVEDKDKIWVRPKEMFLEKIERDGKVIERFKKIE